MAKALPQANSAGFSLGSVKRDLRLSDKVTEQLAEAIMSGHFPPGSRLPSERELGDQLEVSRTVIREAVRSLAAHGLVTVTAGRGVEVATDRHAGATQSMRLMVRGYGEMDYDKVHEVRVPIEVQAAALAAQRAKPEDIARLRALCDLHGEQIAAGDLAAAGQTDLQFHDEIAALADNPLMKAVYYSLYDVLKDVRSPAVHSTEIAESGLRAHRWLLDCIAAGDADAAKSAMERHLAEAERQWSGKS
jgi:GntR family transcriptional repressor for pyruvate dehydrogenase complex